MRGDIETKKTRIGHSSKTKETHELKFCKLVMKMSKDSQHSLLGKYKNIAELKSTANVPENAYLVLKALLVVLKNENTAKDWHSAITQLQLETE